MRRARGSADSPFFWSSGLMSEPLPPRHIKCVIVGNRGVGKTSMCITYFTNTFPGIDYLPRSFDDGPATVMVDNTLVYLGLWDTCDPDNGRLTAQSYPQTDVFLLCYSLIDRDSFMSIQSRWYHEISLYCPQIPFLVIATKSDNFDELISEHLTERNLPKDKEKVSSWPTHWERTSTSFVQL
jgi:Ras-related C3 botulinum toxin substrate 1